MNKKSLLLSYGIVCCVLSAPTTSDSYASRSPKVTVVIVVDQFAYHYFNKLHPYFKRGLKYLLSHGVVYTNAYMPHGQPGTGVGHTALSTGTYAKDHGIIGNSWHSVWGKKIACDDDTSEDSRVIDPTQEDTVYDYGKSSHSLMVDALADQCVMQSTPLVPFRSFSISGKSRSAIMTASKLGKAIWFDSDSGYFTSSKAYFNELPEWLNQFNKKNDLNNLGSISWNRVYPKNPHTYKFFDINNYDYSDSPVSMLDRSLPVPDMDNEKNPFYFFERTPQANKRILDLASVCIKNNANRRTKDRLLMWVCLSPLDKLAHPYGPYSLEAIDMIYHLDRQLQKFIRETFKAVGKHNVTFVLTADHAIMPIPEMLADQGLSLAHRVDINEFLSPLNKTLERKYKSKNVIRTIRGQEIVLGSEAGSQLDERAHSRMVNDVKRSLLSSDYIKNAWTFDELSTTATQKNTILDNIKNQLFRGRSGEIIIQPYPYALFTVDGKGTSHSPSPYEYNTHIPLIVFQSGKFERKCVRQRVTALQLANTLAEIMNVPKPSASTEEVLPELFDPEFQ